MKPLAMHSYVKNSPRAELIFLTLEKIECKNFDLVLLCFLLLSFFFYLKHKLKKYTAYTINDLLTKRLHYY